MAKLAEPTSAVRVGLPPNELNEWANECHLAAAGPCENRQLGEALTADDRRDMAAQAIKALQRRSDLPEVWQIQHLKLLRGELARNVNAARLGMPVVVEAILATEQFHEAVYAVFESLLWWATKPETESVDGGVPKRDWISFESGTRLLRPSPRFQRTERPASPTGKRLTHPYRLEQFVFMLRENHVLPG